MAHGVIYTCAHDVTDTHATHKMAASTVVVFATFSESIFNKLRLQSTGKVLWVLLLLDYDDDDDDDDDDD